MIKASDEYRQAILADTRKTVIKVETDVVSPYVDYTGVNVSDESVISVHEQAYKDDYEISRYATLERNYWLLNGEFNLFQADYSGERTSDKIGIVSDRTSVENYSFSSAVTVEINFEYPSLCQAASVVFSKDINNGYPVDFNVRLFVGSLIVYQWSVTDNTDYVSISPDVFEAYNPTKIILTVTKWSLPGRRARIVRVFPGYKVTWTGDEIASLSIEQNTDPSCVSLPYGTAKLAIDNSQKAFEPRNKEGYFRSIAEGQRVDIYIGLQVGDEIEYKSVGKFYQIDGGWVSSDNGLSLEWNLVDIIGLLSKHQLDVPDKINAYPNLIDSNIPLYAIPDLESWDSDLTVLQDGLWGITPTTLAGWAKLIVWNLGKNFETNYTVDPEYENKLVRLYVPVNRLVFTKAALGNAINLADLIRYVAIESGTWPRADAETGYLAFEPLWDQGVKMTLDNMADYPVMHENENLSAVTITKEYMISTEEEEYKASGWINEIYGGTKEASGKSVNIDSPFVSVNETRANDIFHNVVRNYGGNAYDITWRGDPTMECGDVVTLELDNQHATSARLISQTFDYTSGVLSNCKATLVQPEGYWTYTFGEKITEDITWTVPDGVSVLFVIAVGGGCAGFPGTGGDFDSDGEDGHDGEGAKIYADGMNVTPGQQIPVKIGKGTTNPWKKSDATTFGTITSEKGEKYSPSYTDIRAGAAYGRSGVKDPLPNTGDGGKGGKGGRKGQMHKGKSKDDYGFVHEETIIDVAPTSGKAGSPGASGCVIIYWN